MDGLPRMWRPSDGVGDDPYARAWGASPGTASGRSRPRRSVPRRSSRDRTGSGRVGWSLIGVSIIVDGLAVLVMLVAAGYAPRIPAPAVTGRGEAPDGLPTFLSIFVAAAAAWVAVAVLERVGAHLAGPQARGVRRLDRRWPPAGRAARARTVLGAGAIVLHIAAMFAVTASTVVSPGEVIALSLSTAALALVAAWDLGVRGRMYHLAHTRSRPTGEAGS